MTIATTQFALDSATQLYLGFFGRVPDAAGLKYWSAQIERGTSPLEVAAGFAQSAEFIKTYGALSAKEKVTLAYQNILERAPDAGGLQFWAQQLESGTPIGQIIWSLVNSAFTQAGSADALLVQGKVARALDLMTPTLLDLPLANWSSVSGYGVINVSAALSSILGIDIQEGMEFSTQIEQWPMATLGFSDAWSAGYKGEGVVVAVIDTGLDLSNTALTHSIHSASWNFVANNANIQDDHGHGTAIASIITSKPTEANPNALIGGAFDAQLMVLKAMDATGRGSNPNLVKAIDHAVLHGADVINLSLGSTVFDRATQQAIERAADSGVIVILAAGNASASSPQFPALYGKGLDTAITVGSVYRDSEDLVVWAPSSNRAGSEEAFNYINAPGVKIPAYGLSGVIQSWSGTSFATPYASAAIANLLSAHSGLDAEYIVNALVNTSVELIGASQTTYFA